MIPPVGYETVPVICVQVDGPHYGTDTLLGKPCQGPVDKYAKHGRVIRKLQETEGSAPLLRPCESVAGGGPAEDFTVAEDQEVAEPPVSGKGRIG